MQDSLGKRRSHRREHQWYLVILAGAATALVFAAPATSQTPAASPLAPTLKCRSIPDAQARLACFDAASGDLAAGISRGEVVIVQREQVEDARRSTFGLPESAATAAVISAATVDAAAASPQAGTTPPAKAPPPPEPAKIDTVTQTIKIVTKRNFGLYQVTLEDGSVWRTTEAIATFTPKAGETLTIRRGSLGSYLAQTERSRQVRVQRIS